jgi:hypothetical protein
MHASHENSPFLLLGAVVFSPGRWAVVVQEKGISLKKC